MHFDAGMEQGLQQGMEQGLQQGIRQGECTLLLRLLRQRFGDEVNAQVERRVAAASVEQLERWTGRVSVERDLRLIGRMVVDDVETMLAGLPPSSDAVSLFPHRRMPRD